MVTSLQGGNESKSSSIKFSKKLLNESKIKSEGCFAPYGLGSF
jgi:hypothetical protein